MWKSYLLIAYRNLTKQKFFTFLNVFGLATGLSFCLLLMLYVFEESGYDQHHKNPDDLYLMYSHLKPASGEDITSAASAPAIAMTARDEIPEIEQATRVVYPIGTDEFIFEYEERVFIEEQGVLVDSTFFELFNYDFIEGGPQKVLTLRNSIVLNEQIARKLFQDKPAVGALIDLSYADTTQTFQVTGVVDTQSPKTHLVANFFMTLNSGKWGDFVTQSQEWIGSNFLFTYLHIRADATRQNVETKLSGLLDKYGGEKMRNAGMDKALFLFPMQDIYLKGIQHGFSFRKMGNINYLYVLSVVAIFILIIACINFMNLSTAKATQRSVEVGIRKTMGANRSMLIRQFMSESFLITLLATGLGVLLLEGMMITFNLWFNEDLTINFSSLSSLIPGLLVVILFTGLLAGSYPALYLSAYQPSQVLKSKNIQGRASGWLRRALIVFQFMIAIALISSIFVMQRQMQFIQDKNLGFETEARIVIPLGNTESLNNYRPLRNSIEQINGINAVTGTDNVPGEPNANDFFVYGLEQEVKDGQICYIYNADKDFINTLSFALVAGKVPNPLANKGMDELFMGTAHVEKLLVTRSALDILGVPVEDAIGHRFHAGFGEYEGTLEVSGVIEDFHQTSLHTKMQPHMIYVVDDPRFRNIIASLETKQISTALRQIEEVWKEQNPDLPFQYFFMDDKYAQLHAKDQQLARIITLFTVVAILLSCLGLYGLSAFVAEKKTKEIGVRKVLGAKVSSILLLLSQDFGKLILLAFVLSVPITFYFMLKWLETFAYRIEVVGLEFMYSGLITMCIVFLTVGYHAIKAAHSNPAHSLKSE